MADDPARVQVHRLVNEALETFDSPDVTTAALVRKALRIAGLRRDYAFRVALVYQTIDLTTKEEGPAPAIVKPRDELATLIGIKELEAEMERQFTDYCSTRTFDAKGHMLGVSVSQIEDGLAALQRVYDDAEPASGLTEMDTYFAAERSRNTRGELLPNLQGHRAVLGKIRQRVHDYLVSVETDLLAGKANSDVFQRAQIYINAALKTHAPDALNKFIASQESLTSGTPEDYAHAVTSCRRLIKALADSLYPARNDEVEGIDGVTRSMSDDRYKNRLTEYVRQNVQHKRHKQTVIQIISDLSSRLNALDGLASKGVHDEVSQAEAESCVVWTYMLAGDLVRIADGTSALLIEDAPAP